MVQCLALNFSCEPGEGLCIYESKLFIVSYVHVFDSENINEKIIRIFLEGAVEILFMHQRVHREREQWKLNMRSHDQWSQTC